MRSAEWLPRARGRWPVGTRGTSEQTTTSCSYSDDAGSRRPPRDLIGGKLYKRSQPNAPTMWALLGLVGTALALQAAFGSQVLTLTL